MILNPRPETRLKARTKYDVYTGHIKFECPLLKKQSKRPSKKAMVATWSDSDASDDDSYDDEVPNICLMEIDDFKVTSTFCDSNAYTFD